MSGPSHTIVATERVWAARVIALVALCTCATIAFCVRAWPFTPSAALLIAVSAAVLAVVFNHIARREVSVGLAPIAASAVWPAALAAYHAAGGTVALVCTVAGCWISCFMLVWFSRMALANRPLHDAAEAGTALVLGCAVKGGRPCTTLRLRLDAAIALWQRHPALAVIVTGGVSDPGERSEAAVMADYLVAAGMPAEQIVVEDRALNTEENLANARALIDARDLPRPIWLVTSDFHMWRAAKIARLNGLESIPCGARTPLASRLVQWCREVLIICFGS